MRRRDWVEITAGGTWPENPGTVGSGTAAKDPFSWIRLHNRGNAQVAWNIDGPIFTALGVADPRKYYDVLGAGERRVRNIGRPAATELHFLNLDPVNNALVLVEYDTETIVDLQGSTPVDQTLQAFSVKDTSVFFVETTTALGSSATFTGPWHDALNYHWFGAVALTDQTGTLYLDEADQSTPNVTNLVTKVATAATDANAPTPPAAGQQARAAPTKTVMRFVRTRFINGATAEARLNIQSSLSPLN